MHFSITHKDLTSSTNDDVWDLAKQGAPEGVVVVARSQRQGRGQRGRVWASPEGGLYFSFLLRPASAQNEWPSLSPALARAVCRVLRAECGVDPDVFIEEQGPSEAGYDAAMPLDSMATSDGGGLVVPVKAASEPKQADAVLVKGVLSAGGAPAVAHSIRVKRPNDVVCDSGKICGISLEARAGCVVVGCGVNVFRPDRPVAMDGRNEPAYLSDLAGLHQGMRSATYLDTLLDELLAGIDRQLSSMPH